MATRFLRPWSCVLLAFMASGCSGVQPPVLAPTGQAGGPGDATEAVYALGSVTSYGAANAIITTGYSETELGPDHFEVRAKGSSMTPPERLAKIALARAAEIGTEQKRKFFKAGPPVHSVVCQAARDGSHKGGKVAAERARVAALDVVYAKVALDASYLPSAETFERLTGELAQETISGDAKAAAARASLAQCGK